MTRVNMATKGNKITIDIKGHAEFNPGNDIVCSAASVLAYTLLQNLMDLTNVGLLEYCKTSEKDGNLNIKVKTNSKGSATTKIVIKAIMTGYELLENQYPDNVSLSPE